MPLPWVRLDSNIASHDKILALLADPADQRWQAGLSYVFGIAWSGGQGTDGYVPANALPAIHGTRQTAGLLADYRLWTPTNGGYAIHNYADRQRLSAVADQARDARRRGALRANCVRHHGPDCGCWQDATGVG